MKTVNELILEKEILEGMTHNQWKKHHLIDKYKETYANHLKYDDIVKMLKKDALEDINDRIASAKIKEELEDKSVRISSDRYTRYVSDNIDKICELIYEDRFYLLKSFYTYAKDCAGIGDFLLEEVREVGYIPEEEIENIKKVFNGRTTIMAYRGINKYNSKSGHSYTLSKEKAEWFANRYGEGGQVIEREVSIGNVVFYDDLRKEQEVFLLEEGESL